MASLRFGDHPFHPAKLQHHHDTEKSEDGSRSERGDHRREVESQERGENPVSGTTQRLALCPVTIRENLGNEDPDNGTLTDRMGSDEGKDAKRDDAKVFGEKGPGTQTERHDVAKGSDVEKSPPAESINEPESEKGEDQIGDSNSNGLKQSCLFIESGEFKGPRRTVENRIDP